MKTNTNDILSGLGIIAVIIIIIVLISGGSNNNSSNISQPTQNDGIITNQENTISSQSTNTTDTTLTANSKACLSTFEKVEESLNITSEYYNTELNLCLGYGYNQVISSNQSMPSKAEIINIYTNQIILEEAILLSSPDIVKLYMKTVN